jgi:hypothetical protein
MPAKIYQIFYDETTRCQVDAAFIPLDNTANLRPDWFEFWVILNYLRSNTLEEGTWYGFLSPKFSLKTRFNAQVVHELLTSHDDKDVAIFPHSWDQACYYRNPFEQGEREHPGLLDISQNFFNHIGVQVDLAGMVSSASRTVFSNFVIAKKAYWVEWHAWAEKFWDYVENTPEQDPRLQTRTLYPDAPNGLPMKTFVQERFASVLLSNKKFRVLYPDISEKAFISRHWSTLDGAIRAHMMSCDLLKRKYLQTGDVSFLDMYYKIRSSITQQER